MLTKLSSLDRGAALEESVKAHAAGISGPARISRTLVVAPLGYQLTHRKSLNRTLNARADHGVRFRLKIYAMIFSASRP